MARRRGWIAPEELERELADLPDVASKILPPEDEPAEAATSSKAPRPGSGGAGPAAGA